MFADLTRCWQQSLRERAAGARTDVRTVRTVRGVRVVVHNTRPDVDTAHVFARLDAALCERRLSVFRSRPSAGAVR